ncbi:MAG: hypothetical protein O7D91_06820 [Planctomycetota bacterium]|nr:hypothetical protein [Planctomycetota bacterium]
MYENELIELSAAGVRFLVIGGVAVGMHGYPAATFDLDILPDLSGDNLGLLITALGKLGYQPMAPVDPNELKDPDKRRVWYEDKNMKVFSFVKADSPRDVVDVMIYHPIDFEKCFDRRQTVSIRGHEISVAAAEDLLELKKVAGRNKDQAHIAALERFLKGRDRS